MKDQEQQLLDEIYKGCQMGLDALKEMIPKVDSKDLAADLNEHQKDLLELQNKALKAASSKKNTVKSPGTMEKLMVKGSTKLQTMVRSTPSHFADMLIKGSNMGITTIQKFLNDASDVKDEIKKLAKQFIQLEQANIEKMKPYL